MEEEDRSRLLDYEYAIVSRTVEEIEKNARRADGRIANCRAIPLREATNPVRLSRVRGFDAIEAWRFSINLTERRCDMV